MNNFRKFFGLSSKSPQSRVEHNSYNLNNLLSNRFIGGKDEILASNETIFSIITRLSNTLASLPLALFKDSEEVSDNISDLLTVSPNDNMSAFEFINKLETDRNKDGNGYALIVRNPGTNLPEELVPIPANSVEIMINTDDQSLWYHIMLNNENIYISAYNMIHVKNITGAGHYKGISPIDVLTDTLKFNDAVKKFSLHEMNKIDSFHVTYGANVDEEGQQAVVDSVKSFIDDNGGAIFSTPGVDIQKIDRDFQTGDVADTDAITNRRIANAFNIPIQFINESLSGAGYNSNEQLMTQFVQMTLTPIIKQYEQEFDRKLLTINDRANNKYFRFNVDGLMRGDMQARTQYYQVLFRGGAITDNEIRAKENLPQIKDPMADKLFVSGDLYPLDMDPSQRKGVNTNDKQETLDDESNKFNESGD